MPHIHEKIDLTVVGFIVANSKVLLVLHKKLGKWLPPGGHVELDEDPDQAIFREILEETGLEIELFEGKPEKLSSNTEFLHTPQYVDIHKISDTHRHIGLTYFARPRSGEVKLAEREHDDIRWFTELELDDSKYKLMPEVKFYACKAIKILS